MKQIISLILILILTQSINTQSSLQLDCLQFKSSQCIRCPLSSHLQKNSCFKDIVGCVQYHQNGYDCVKCNSTFSYLLNKSCQLFVSANQVQKYSQFSSNLGSMFGEFMFNLITIQQAQRDNYFQLCDNFMKKGQYNHFISRTGLSIISVHTYDQSNSRQFKILYEGSGGGILLCIIGINFNTNQIQLRSFVVIGVHQIVDECIDYTTQSNCIRCQNGFHLENSVCYKNIPKCVRYYKNICVECKGYSILVENRCISDCKSLKDTRSIRFYQNYKKNQGNLPNIQRTYSQY